jgi:site-specific DNA-cytosine methylase
MRLGTCASLFSGGGGWDVGAVAAGLRPIWSVELNPEIAAVFHRNFHKQFPSHGTKVGSVFDVDPAALERPDVLLASPPCQATSRARMRQGLVPRLDADAGLAVVGFLKALRPGVMLLENVDAYQHHPAFKAICDAARDLGYECDAAVLDAAEFGVPSTRRRLVARFALDGLPAWPKPRAPVSWLDAVRDLLPTFAPSKLAPWQLARVERLAASPQGKRMPGPWLISSNNVSTAAFKAGAVIRVARGADEPAFAVVASYPAMSQTRVLFDDGRVLLVPPRGFARFQSFPDDYELPESDRLATRVLGNAVPPGLSLAMLRPFLAPGGRARTPRQLDLAV